eukprot:scaffold16900_cov105-Isochrysis_galbana.AAC.13
MPTLSSPSSARVASCISLRSFARLSLRSLCSSSCISCCSACRWLSIVKNEIIKVEKMTIWAMNSRASQLTAIVDALRPWRPPRAPSPGGPPHSGNKFRKAA